MRHNIKIKRQKHKKEIIITKKASNIQPRYPIHEPYSKKHL